MAQMNCPNCGKTINENDNACPHCACVLSGNVEKTQKYKGVRPGYGLIVAFKRISTFNRSASVAAWNNCFNNLLFMDAADGNNPNIEMSDYIKWFSSPYEVYTATNGRGEILIEFTGVDVLKNGEPITSYYKCSMPEDYADWQKVFLGKTLTGKFQVATFATKDGVQQELTPCGMIKAGEVDKGTVRNNEPDLWRWLEHRDKRSLHSKSTGLKVKGNNKRKAEAMMRDIVSEWERQANNARPADNPKMRECIAKWLEQKRLTIRPNTLASYNVAAKAHIIPELGDIRICDISRQQIQRYYEKLQRDGVSANTMKKHRVIINGVLKDAVLDDVISVNVSEYVSLPKAKRFEGKALSEAQVADLLTALEEQAEPIRSVITLALVYGLRRSEICGLRWKDIDFQNNVIHIRNTVTEYSGVIYEAETTKTKAGCRDLYLIQSTTEYLASLQQKQKASRIYGEKVCVYSDGRTVKPEYITRASKRFLTACGYDDIRLHVLRATAATILAKRVPIKQVKEYLGHEDVHTTLTYYDHVLNEDRIATSNAMDDFLTGAGFASSCSESCSESGETDTDKVIFIDTILPKKLAIT